MFENKKERTAFVAKSGPSLGRKRPRRAAIAGWVGCRYRIPLAKTIAISGSIEPRDHGPMRRFRALALQAENFRNGSKRRPQPADTACLFCPPQQKCP